MSKQAWEEAGVFFDESVGPVELGMSVEINPGTVIIGPVKIGSFVKISSGVVIGEEAETYGTAPDPLQMIEIGDNTVLREHVVVQRGLTGGAGTKIGPNCYIMHGTHVAHDVILEEGVTAAPFVVFGGHTVVQRWANMGIQSSTHQWVTVGAFAMVGMHAAVIDDVQPCVKCTGVPARVTGLNTVGLARHRAAGRGVPADEHLSIKDCSVMYEPGTSAAHLMTQFGINRKRRLMKVVDWSATEAR